MARLISTLPFARLGLLLLAGATTLACDTAVEATEDVLEEDDDDDGDDVRDFRADLSGEHERPDNVITNMRGDANITVADDSSSADYSVFVDNGFDVIAAHIHVGGPEEAGPIVVTLFSSPDDPVDIEGILVQDSFTEDDFEGPLEGSTMEDLLEEMRAGNTYVNVHTTQYPDGEIRGQLDEDL